MPFSQQPHYCQYYCSVQSVMFNARPHLQSIHLPLITCSCPFVCCILTSNHLLYCLLLLLVIAASSPRHITKTTILLPTAIHAISDQCLPSSLPLMLKFVVLLTSFHKPLPLVDHATVSSASSVRHSSPLSWTAPTTSLLATWNYCVSLFLTALLLFGFVIRFVTFLFAGKTSPSSWTRATTSPLATCTYLLSPYFDPCIYNHVTIFIAGSLPLLHLSSIIVAYPLVPLSLVFTRFCCYDCVLELSTTYLQTTCSFSLVTLFSSPHLRPRCHLHCCCESTTSILVCTLLLCLVLLFSLPTKSSSCLAIFALLFRLASAASSAQRPSLFVPKSKLTFVTPLQYFTVSTIKDFYIDPAFSFLLPHLFHCLSFASYYSY